MPDVSEFHSRKISVKLVNPTSGPMAVLSVPRTIPRQAPYISSEKQIFSKVPEWIQ